VPRTGNGWFRGLFEAATGVCSLSVFEEHGYRYDERARAFLAPCGWLGDCALLHPPGLGEPYLVKTHYPFTTRSTDPAVVTRWASMRVFFCLKYWGSSLQRRRQSDVLGTVSYVISPVRNPLDNHEAYIRYVASVNPEFRSTFPHLGLRSFVRAWAEHHEYWFAQESPLAIFR
jgi:hypothetical protein